MRKYTEKEIRDLTDAELAFQYSRPKALGLPPRAAYIKPPPGMSTEDFRKYSKVIQGQRRAGKVWLDSHKHLIEPNGSGRKNDRELRYPDMDKFPEGTGFMPVSGSLSWWMLEPLTKRQRKIARLFYEDGRSQSEIAEKMGVSQQVIDKQIQAINTKLKKLDKGAKLFANLS